MKKIFKILLAIIGIGLFLYGIIMALVYYQYNFTDLKDRKPIEASQIETEKISENKESEISISGDFVVTSIKKEIVFIIFRRK